jgi:hypothetical protein
VEQLADFSLAVSDLFQQEQFVRENPGDSRNRTRSDSQTAPLDRILLGNLRQWQYFSPAATF